MKKRMPRWLRAAVFERDGGCCRYTNERGEVCGRTTDLFIEDVNWSEGLAWDPADHRVTCLYHLQDGQGLDRVDWSTAAQA
jgi:hypothetical protein